MLSMLGSSGVCRRFLLILDTVGLHSPPRSFPSVQVSTISQPPMKCCTNLHAAVRWCLDAWNLVSVVVSLYLWSQCQGIDVSLVWSYVVAVGGLWAEPLVDHAKYFLICGMPLLELFSFLFGWTSVRMLARRDVDSYRRLVRVGDGFDHSAFHR